MTGRSSCPECGTILRIRDRSFVGRRVNCPECKTILKIEATDDKGHFVTRRASKAESGRANSNPAISSSHPEVKVASTRSFRSSIVRVIYSPLTAAWLLAIAVSVLIAVLALSPKFRFAQTRPNAIRVEPKPQEEVPAAVESHPVMTEAVTKVQDIENVLPANNGPPAEVSALEPESVDEPLLPPMNMDKQEPPAVVVKAPKKKDIPAMLAQPITSYSQPRIRRRDLLEALKEQLGADIRYDPQELGEDRLDETVSFELANTSIGEIIKTIADSARWEIAIEDTGIRLGRKRAPAGP